MAIFRINKTKDYTVISNYHLRDMNLSLKAKGLLTLMLSLPDDWDYSISGLTSICKEGESAVKSALDELKKSGYLVVTKLTAAQSGTGVFEYAYDIYERPINLPLENLGVENLPLENRRQLNTKKQSTKELNTKNKRFIKPTVKQVDEYAHDMGYVSFDSQRFCDYYDSVGWKVGKKPMVDWKAAVRNWHSNNRKWGKQQETSPYTVDYSDAFAAAESILAGGFNA